MMKLKHEMDGQRLKVQLRGEIDGARCSCLEHFWDRHVDKDGYNEAIFDMRDVDAIDAVAIATMVTLLRRLFKRPVSLILDSAPQVLAHTLYKAALLEDRKRLRLINEVTEEPYAG
jgi:anti-anti-sigma factor